MRLAKRTAIPLLLIPLLLACGEEAPVQPAPPEGAQAELKVLYERTVDLQKRVQAGDGITADQFAELDALMQDIEAWNQRYDDEDVVLKRGPRSGPAGEELTEVASVPAGGGGGGGGPFPCSPCEDVTIETWPTYRVCFLIPERSGCDTTTGTSQCVYWCISFPIWF